MDLVHTQLQYSNSNMAEDLLVRVWLMATGLLLLFGRTRCKSGQDVSLRLETDKPYLYQQPLYRSLLAMCFVLQSKFSGSFRDGFALSITIGQPGIKAHQTACLLVKRNEHSRCFPSGEGAVRAGCVNVRSVCSRSSRRGHVWDGSSAESGADGTVTSDQKRFSLWRCQRV